MLNCFINKNNFIGEIFSFEIDELLFSGFKAKNIPTSKSGSLITMGEGVAVKLILFPNTKLFEEINGEKIYLELRSIIFPKHRILSKIIPPTKSGICTTTTHRSLGLLLFDVATYFDGHNSTDGNGEKKTCIELSWRVRAKLSMQAGVFLNMI